MITVRGRELVIPVAERQIGTQFDNNSETRQFKINRLTVGGIDISNLDFRIDLRYGKETKDTDVLEKEITDEHVILTWTVSAASVKQVGTVFIALRGSDDFGTVKWATNQGYLYVGDTINTPDGAEMALSQRIQDALKAKGCDSRKIILGCRPEHMVMKSASGADTMEATVDVSEMMGSEIHLHVSCHDKDVVVRIPTTELDASQRGGLQYGTKIAISFPADLVHLFDPETEENLL